MLTNKDRYFISNIIYPFQELVQIIYDSRGILYFDDKYSPLKDKVDHLCTKILHVFEQNEFSSEHGISKRNDLNQSDEMYKRILSYAIKVKHGNVTNRHYIDVDLTLPISVFYIESENTYTTRYTPLLNEHDFITDYHFIIKHLIELYDLQITFDMKLHEKIQYVRDNTIFVELQDIFNYKENGMTESMSIRTLKLVNEEWIPSDLALNIDIKLMKST